MNRRYQAILLMGPTGAGKSPLGDYAQLHPPSGKQCLHFDFGAQLRAATQHHVQLTTELRQRIQTVLEEGRLLTPADGPIALTLLNAALEPLDPQTACLVLNGLPRNPQQASDIEPRINIRQAIHLHADPETIMQRIQNNSGGDRTHRTDDTITAIQKRLERFQTNIAPLMQWLTDRHIPITTLAVNTTTSPSELWPQIQSISWQDHSFPQRP